MVDGWAVTNVGSRSYTFSTSIVLYNTNKWIPTINILRNAGYIMQYVNTWSITNNQLNEVDNAENIP